MAEPIRNSGGSVAAGSEDERRAARELEKRLEGLGREVVLEPTRIRPAFALTHAIHAVVGVIASVLAVYQPGIGFLLALIATVSTFGDLTGAFFLVRSLTPVRASQNVVSEEDSGKPGLVVLSARYDTRRSGMLLGPRLVNVWPRALFISLAVITACSFLRVLGLQPVWLTVLQFIPTVILIAMTPLLIDLALSEPGGDRNERAIDAVLECGERLGGRLEHFDLTLVFTGGSAHFGLGMRDWLRRHGKGLDKEATALVAVDSAPGENAMVVVKEGPVVASRMHSMLIELAGEEPEQVSSRELSDAHLARAAGLPAIRLTPSASVADFLERIDEEIGPRLA